MLRDLAYFAAVNGILNVLIAKLAYGRYYRRGASAPSLFKRTVFKRLAELIHAQKPLAYGVALTL